MPFSGFSQGAIDFLAQLSQHNDRAWFEAHRSEYEYALIEPAKALVEALRPRLRSLDPKLQAIARVRGSIHALERRRRFAKSARPPYRESLDLWFWAGRRRAWDNSGFWLRLSSTRLILAAGMVEFQPTTRARYREHLLADERGAELARIVEAMGAEGYLVGGESYKRPPRGVPPDHPRVTLAKHSGLFATLNGEHPSELGTPAFVDFCAGHFARMAPLHAWLVGLLG